MKFRLEYGKVRKLSYGTFFSNDLKMSLLRKRFKIRFSRIIGLEFPTRDRLGGNSIENWQ